MLMSLLCDLLESSYGLQQQFLQTKGFLIISYLLEKVISNSLCSLFFTIKAFSAGHDSFVH